MRSSPAGKATSGKTPRSPLDPFTLAAMRRRCCSTRREDAVQHPGIAMLTYTVTASLRDSPHKDIATLLRERGDAAYRVRRMSGPSAMAEPQSWTGCHLVGSGRRALTRARAWLGSAGSCSARATGTDNDLSTPISWRQVTVTSARLALRDRLVEQKRR